MSTAVLTSGIMVGARELIAELGGDPDALAAQAGLLPHAFEDPDILVQADRIMDFFELAATTCHCPDFGLRHARRLPVGLFRQIWLGMRTAGTLRAVLDNLVRTYGLYTDGGSFQIEPTRDGLWMNYAFLPLGRWGVDQMINLTLGRLCLIINESLGHPWRPKRVLLRLEPADPAPFIEFFGAGVAFGQERNALFIERSTLDAPLVPGHLGKHVRPPVALRTSLKGSAVISQVRALLAVLLRHEQCALESIAQTLGLSERTLQRRLTEAGTSYRELVDVVRADLALRYVQRTDLGIAFVANLLGYDNQPAFSRAFRRWHGVSPREARANGPAETRESAALARS